MTGAPTMEEPWPLRVMLKHFQDWVGRLGQAWVAGEISKIRSAGSQTFFTLRDENGDLSADVMVHPRKFADLPRAPAEGDRVILLVSIQVTKQTKILLRASEIHRAGVGDRLAEIERGRRLLAEGGLFAPHPKRERRLIPGAVGGLPWQEAQDHAPPWRVVNRTRPRSGWPGAPAWTLKRSSCCAGEVSAACVAGARPAPTISHAIGAAMRRQAEGF